MKHAISRGSCLMRGCRAAACHTLVSLVLLLQMVQHLELSLGALCRTAARSTHQSAPLLFAGLHAGNLCSSSCQTLWLTGTATQEGLPPCRRSGPGRCPACRCRYLCPRRRKRPPCLARVLALRANVFCWMAWLFCFRQYVLLPRMRSCARDIGNAAICDPRPM